MLDDVERAYGVVFARMGSGVFGDRLLAHVGVNLPRLDAAFESDIAGLRHPSRKAGGPTADVENDLAGLYLGRDPRVVGPLDPGSLPRPLLAQAAKQIIVERLVPSDHRIEERQATGRFPKAKPSCRCQLTIDPDAERHPVHQTEQTARHDLDATDRRQACSRTERRHRSRHSGRRGHSGRAGTPRWRLMRWRLRV